MHETSPGGLKEHEISITNDNKSELNGANSFKINIDMESVINENIDNDFDSEQRIYDDPCDLMEDYPIFQLTKSRSWFCCPSSDATSAANIQTNNLFYNRYPDYSLVTEAPRTQLHCVCCLVKSHENSVFYPRPPR